MVHVKASTDLGATGVGNGYSSDETQAAMGYELCDCSHIAKSCEPNKLRKAVKADGVRSDCQQCVLDGTVVPELQSDLEFEMEYDDSLWMCLQCGTQLCGRTKKQHALAHNAKPHSDEHNLVLNTTYWIVWCYKCDQAVNPSAKKKLLSCVDFVKREKEKHSGINDSQKIIPPGGEPQSSGLGSGTNDTTKDNPASATLVLRAHSRETADQAHSSSSTMATSTTNNKVTPPVVDLEILPRVRGLSNLGNTCFFNSVLQCLAQTPYLIEILKECSEPGEKFQLPGGKLKLDNEEEIVLRPILGELHSWGGLTAELAGTLDQLQGAGGVFVPKSLLQQLTSKWPQFAGGDQHDAHELLRHLLESVRCEDLRRYQSVILKTLGYSTSTDPKKVDNEIKQKIKFYGNQVTERILRPEQVFRGFLASTLTCQDCWNTSSRHEYFLDISVPITMEKPHPPIRRKPSPEPAVSSSSSSKSMSKKEKERQRREKRNQKKQAAKLANTVSIGDNSESSSGDNTDGDVEDNVDEVQNKSKVVDSNGNTTGGGEKEIVIEPLFDSAADGNNDKESTIKNEIVEVGISSTGVNNLIKQSKVEALVDEFESSSLTDSSRRRKRTISYADWSTTLAPRYQCDDGECSVQSCLNNFTWAELMTGNNKVTCEACTERINGKDGKPIQTNATKQLLISSPPAVLILHLKRFQVGGRGMFRKIAKHVTFPFVLDIAPFCGSKVKRLPNVKPHTRKLPYSLYGVVEHSGTMFGGHYVAYVKVRPKLGKADERWKFLPQGSKAELDQIDEQMVRLEASIKRAEECHESDDASSTSSSSEEGATGFTPPVADPEPLPGKWYYVSDSRVQSVSEKEVLNAQAYLLFYERIE